jgi:hypothetical protein
MELKLTKEEIEWLGLENQSPNIQPIESDSPPKKKAKQNELKIFIGELMATAQSLSRGKDIIRPEDCIEVMRINTFKKSKSNFLIRLKNKRTKSEFASLNSSHSSFLSTLIDLNLCELSIKIIHVPENLKIWDELIVSIKIWLHTTSFEELNQPNSALLSSCKQSLELLFEKTGLLNPKQKSIMKMSDEISGKELSKIYSKAGLLDQKITVMEPADGMALKLREYQGFQNLIRCSFGVYGFKGKS